ncbi:MAG TPA: dolichol kinase [Bacteroidota bacterium]|nr:dolichol kinase [Bacteroidota bacterium]
MKDIINVSNKTNLKKELIRKGIHMISLSIPIIYYYIPKDLALSIIIPLTLGSIILDILRYYSSTVANVFYKIFGNILRKHEVSSKKTLNGGTYVLISASICIFIFPKVLVVMSFSILIISDILAALVGMSIGKIKINGKTLEGSLAFFISAVIVILVTPKITYTPIEYIIGIIGALIGTLSELYSFNLLDDNFAIPVSISSTMWLLYWLLLPNVNLYAFEIVK